MCDFFDDFEDDFDNDDFMDEASFEDSLEGKMDEPFTDDTELDDESIEAEDQDDDLTVDPFFIGGAMGFAYEEGVEERRRKRLLKEQSKRRKRKRFPTIYLIYLLLTAPDIPIDLKLFQHQ